MSNMNAKHNPRVSKNSAGGVSKLLWYTETKATVKLLLSHSVDEVRDIVMSENLYSQKSEDRLKREFSEIKNLLEVLSPTLDYNP